MRESRFTLDLGSVRAARLFACAAVGDAPADVLEVVAAIVGELAANAVRHAATGFVVRVESDERRIRVEVADVGAGLPVAKSPGPADPSGRGLQLVSALADDWGVGDATGEPGKAVWATLWLDGPGARRVRSVEPAGRTVGGT